MKQLPIHILGIAPYEGMQVALARAAESFPNVILDVRVGDLEEGAEIAKSFNEDSYDCIISRGCTAKEIQLVTNIPVVEVPITSHDILRTMKLAENYTNRFAIVAFPSITGPAHNLCSILKSDTEIITVHNIDEVYEAVERLKLSGINMIIGDRKCHQIAQELGMNALLLVSGEESLQASIAHAINIGSSFQRLRREHLFLSSIMRGESEQLVVLEEEGSLYYCTSETIEPDMLRILQQKIPEIPQRAPLRFYHNRFSRFYRITGQIIYASGVKYYLFHFAYSPTPVRSGKSGVRIYSKSECELFFNNSFFNLSGALGELRSKLDTIASINQPVIIMGEMGTGKLQMAHYLYLRSSGNTKPFVVIDCAVVSDKTWENLLNRYDSPLNDSGNTICFQNFEALSPANGWALIETIVATKMSIRERLIFCYNHPEEAPLADVTIQLLRSISCLPLNPLPLRKRTDEISSLACLYLGELNLEFGKQISGFDTAAFEQLRAFQWPGNYIQFKRIIRELAINTESFYIQGADVAEILSREKNKFSVKHPSKPEKTPTLSLNQIIHQAIEQALADNDGNQSAAAKQLGIGRSTLWRHMNET